ncbi:hypothetical protein [Candidatus Lokiarchaeum ossiferum]|uniref:hypothetical protein n=1 Tax=Candidatus Lokiarchaeum ossiferum TaxID=2951803 RepID=UPI00352D0F25
MIDEIPNNIGISDTGHIFCKRFVLINKFVKDKNIPSNFIDRNCDFCENYINEKCFLSRDEIDGIIKNPNFLNRSLCYLCFAPIENPLALLLKKYIETKATFFRLTDIPILCCECYRFKYHGNLNARIIFLSKKLKMNTFLLTLLSIFLSIVGLFFIVISLFEIIFSDNKFTGFFFFISSIILFPIILWMVNRNLKIDKKHKKKMLKNSEFLQLIQDL